MPLSRLDIRREITKLNRLDSRQASYAAIHSTYQRMTDGLRIVVGKAGGGELFYRVRRTNGVKPLCISEFQAPPPQLITGYQRCNPPGTPMFYAASRRVGALIEARVQEGETVYISQWIGRNQIPVNRIFDTDENQFVPGVERATIHGPNDDVILAHLDTLFTRPVPESFSDIYKFTAAIAQQLTSNFPPNDFEDVHDDGYVALKYPSVWGASDFHNTAMHASFASERLELLHVMELRVLSVGAADVSVEVLDTAIDFEEGEVRWSGKPNLVPTLLDKERSVPFVFDGARWNLELFKDAITPTYISALISE